MRSLGDLTRYPCVIRIALAPPVSLASTAADLARELLGALVEVGHDGRLRCSARIASARASSRVAMRLWSASLALSSSTSRLRCTVAITRFRAPI